MSASISAKNSSHREQESCQSGALPAKATLSDKAAREWYLNAESKILQFVDSSAPLVKQAEQAWAHRSYLRQGVRDGVSNRSLAEQLGKDRPHLSWQDIIEKYSKKYFGNDLWKKIINAAQRSDPEVTKT
ncbi:hypothetical protein ACIPLR_18260 [Herbaspirillum huttiense]|jgi:filamentous hemagglutinin|uniref:hypothetical protein n=1 Tax=Herbaspirillum TaxID=963 RepID=UPI001AC0AABD|nr:MULTISPECIES: hypothetical protein [Herbaspirillum]MCP4565984.1 hypothetical protein [FCB group bacterium]MBN9357977.1 hypothetical protein [Herbaspirillum huttiense]MCP3657436.1 hypothetical protein [Herbaspirillum sp.]MCP3946155.1 hypothetical protein [Herbaspirillum sp.]MCP4032471.1 hypothetical protein [Herbaspirillum sp.]